MNLVDLKPIVDLAFTFLDGLVVTVAVPLLAAWLMTKLKIDATNALGARVITAAQNGASLAIGQAKTLLDAHATIEVNNAMVAAAANYVIAAVPDALKSLKVTPAGLNALVEAKIHAALPSPAIVITAPAVNSALNGAVTMKPIADPPASQGDNVVDLKPVA